MTPDRKSESTSAARRKLVAALGAGGIAGLHNMPSAWQAPSVAAVMLPAHASTSAPCSIDNCVAGSLQVVTNFDTQFNINSSLFEQIPGISENNNSLTGSGSTTIFDLTNWTISTESGKYLCGMRYARGTRLAGLFEDRTGTEYASILSQQFIEIDNQPIYEGGYTATGLNNGIGTHLGSKYEYIRFCSVPGVEI